jgi:hypothetical protein
MTDEARYTTDLTKGSHRGIDATGCGDLGALEQRLIEVF